MLSNIIRLFGRRPVVTDIKEVGRHGDGDLPDSDVSCQPSSSKKRREDGVAFLPDRDCGNNKLSVDSNDDLDVIEIKKEMEGSNDNDITNAVLATAPDCNPYEKISDLKTQLRIAEANHNTLQESASAHLICSSCKQLPRTLPLFSCTNHHKSCINCTSSKFSTCQTCSKPLLEESSPLLASLLSSFSRCCTWANTGYSYKSILK